MQEPCSPDKAPKVDEMMEILSHHLRREVVVYFENTGSTASLEELLNHIDRRISDADRHSLEVKLHHQHLPRLEAGGWLEFDSEGEYIRYHGNSSAPEYLAEIASVFRD